MYRPAEAAGGLFYPRRTVDFTLNGRTPKQDRPEVCFTRGAPAGYCAESMVCVDSRGRRKFLRIARSISPGKPSRMSPIWHLAVFNRVCRSASCPPCSRGHPAAKPLPIWCARTAGCIPSQPCRFAVHCTLCFRFRRMTLSGPRGPTYISARVLGDIRFRFVYCF